MIFRGARLVAATAVAALLAGTAACSPRELPYEEQIASWRAEKDRFMRSSESPVAEAQRANFAELPYFPTNQEYRVPAALTPGKVEDILEMPTSTGQRRHMRRIGALEFTLNG